MSGTSQIAVRDRTVGSDPIPQLDGVRGLAAVGIMVFHVWALGGYPQLHLFGIFITPIAASLFLAVDMFFILSGFLLARAWFVSEMTGRSRPSVRTYWKRRALRILPAYYVCLVVVVAAGLLAGTVDPAQLKGTVGFWNLLAHALVIGHYVPLAAGEFGGLTGAQWTLPLEVTFYAVLPLLAVALGGRRWLLGILVAFAVAVGWLWLCFNSLGPVVHALMGTVDGPAGDLVGFPQQERSMRTYLASWAPGYLPAFVVGMVIARLYVAARLQQADAPAWWARPRTAVVAFIAGATLTLGLVYTLYLIPNTNGLIHYAKHTPAALTLGLVMVGLTLGPPSLVRPLASRLGRALGSISYSVFLYHAAVILLLLSETGIGKLPLVPRCWVLLIATCAIVLPVSAVSYRFVERPFLERRSRRKPDEI